MRYPDEIYSSLFQKLLQFFDCFPTKILIVIFLKLASFLNVSSQPYVVIRTYKWV